MRMPKSVLAVVAAATLALSACAPTAESANEDPTATGSESESAAAPATPVKVGIIYSQTGPLAAYGEAFRTGFEAGLDYATDGTNEVNGHALEITYTDDAGNADKAVAAAKDAIGNGTKIIGGTVVSGVALAMAEQAEQNKVLYISGPAATDAITGINDYTFRSGRQSVQDVMTAASFVESGQKVLVFAQNNAFGQGNVAAVKAVFGGVGAEVSELLVPEDATEFTPFARQIIDAKPDMVFVAWAGATSGAMWQGLSQQGVLDATKVVTGLGDISTYGAYGEASDRINFLNHYFEGATDNEVNKAMIERVNAAGAEVDLFTPDGFVAAQMIVQAVAEGGDDVDAMVSALEGWEFDAPKGKQTIRESDHAMLQPMFQARLVDDGGTWKPELIEEVPADKTTPAEAQ
ncbi:substrate-binding domain-containing protein [Tessaracoccus oleiagri]|uniref:Branched-chain amino acid transport system substrate-binding protein n=1 Tax=Tessaracoccus oleiagri TaxID=686624 RepID=A0A1G9KJB1_9ACTN|nr:substrate-binding domain-containing protein [Tessaracoccus oleiagri]SDL49545.1 branched-chain amino acid transport system substrate-binding protein [Tessaracoccus oleiagri]